MRKWIFWMGWASLHAQPLKVQPSQVLFSPTYEVSIDSQVVTFYNEQSYPVEVQQVGSYALYDDWVFFPETTSFVVQPSDSQKVKIYFKPNQNIYYNAELIFQTRSVYDNAFYGSVRLDVQGQGRFSNPYYNPTENLFEEDLKNALKTLINSGYVSLGYSQRILMFSTIDNWKVNGRGSANDKVECVYTGRTIENYPMNTSSLVNPPWNFNTEHVFPQSYFNQNEPMRSDLFHLFPTDESINNTRGNMPFNWVVNPIGQNNGSKWDANYFEPRDAFKGYAARALMYFYLKYQDFNNFFAPQENVLRTWHYLFPPDSIEKKRCNDIYNYQHNRNPWIDYPQFLKRITRLAGTSTAPVLNSWLTLDTLIDFGNRPFGNDWFYDFIITNTGNQNLNLQNLHVTHPDLQIVEGGNDTLLLPGESLTIRLKINSFNPISDSLHINFPALNHTLRFPVTYHSTAHSDRPSPFNKFKVYPNPASHQFKIEPFPAEVKCMDLVGKEFELQVVGKEWLCEPCKEGVYILKIENEYHPLMIVK